ncbi:hypothetical protein CYMTET_48658 [Cymbomonas tetramitiformis]|uniref:Wax synthase domain-containing protein n=1 Tax=Cymbomonas tetramitiformis TaxID=36881 RepID=A0AAE0EVI2_9CHLO|nr:hypothetical protein CYMTET_48658 [Cymbomonas tetramitiformis]
MKAKRRSNAPSKSSDADDMDASRNVSAESAPGNPLARKLMFTGEKPEPPVLLCLLTGQMWQHVMALALDLRNWFAILFFSLFFGLAIYTCTHKNSVRGGARAYFPVLLGLIPSIVVPWFLTYTPIMRAFYGLACTVMMLRLVIMVNNPHHFENCSFNYRMTFVVWVGSDYRTARKMEAKHVPALRNPRLGDVACALVLCVSSQLSLQFGYMDALLGDLGRWTAAACLMYNSMTMLDGVYYLPLLHFAHIEVLPAMDGPIYSTNLKEFWGTKWDKAVQMLLLFSVYKPLQKAGLKTFAIIATFAASGLLHVYPLLLVGLSPLNFAYMFMFFMLQPVLMQLEDMLPFKLPWPANLIPLFCTAPLFLEPLLQIFGW